MPARLWLRSMGVAAVVAMLASVGVVAAQGGPKRLSAAAAEGGTLRVARASDFDSLDPAISYSSEVWGIEFATCAKLYNFADAAGPEGLSAIPEVAKGLPTVSSDGRTNTIELRRTFRFHTGAAVTAQSFVAAFSRAANPSLKSPAVNYLHEIVGADAVVNGRATSISGVRALGRFTLQIRTTRPLADLVSRLTMPFFCPVVSATPRELDLPPGSGPYYIASHVPNRQLVLKRNPFYRGDRHPHVTQIVWTIGLAGEACRVALDQNQIDFCGNLGVPSADYPEIVRTYGINRAGGRFFFNSTLSSGGLVFNHARPAFKGLGQIPLKQAINWTIDRRALTAAGGYLGGKRTDQILPPGLRRDASIYPLGGVSQESLTRARGLFRKATFKPTSLVLYAFNDPQDVAQAQIVQYDLKQIGIRVDVTYLGFSEFFSRMARRGEPYDIVLFPGFSADYPDPVVFFALLDGRSIKSGENWAKFNRPRYNRRIAAIGRLRGDARRIAWANLDVDLMRNDPPWAPFETQGRRDFISPSFGCFVWVPGTSAVDLVAACKK